jgi:sRNA-binding protein
MLLTSRPYLSTFCHFLKTVFFSNALFLFRHYNIKVDLWCARIGRCNSGRKHSTYVETDREEADKEREKKETEKDRKRDRQREEADKERDRKRKIKRKRKRQTDREKRRTKKETEKCVIGIVSVLVGVIEI